MATTESRTGFRLPWSSEDRSGGRQADEPQADEPKDEATDRAETPEMPEASVATPDAATETTAAAETTAAVDPSVGASQDPATTAPSIESQVIEGTPVLPSASPVAPSRPAAVTPRKPTKFLADLSKAMQAAAETSRAATLEQFQADAKAHVEQVHARSADEIAEIRREADDDIVGIREWSKAELARIREETERKIGGRRKDLEGELEAHAARVERRIDAVQSRVSSFEAEMDRFFERLLHEEDPAEFAAMAENLPEPPSFDEIDEASYTALEPDPVYAATADQGATDAADAVFAATAVADEPAAVTEPEAAPEPETALEPAEAVLADDATAEAATQDDPAAIVAAMAAIEAAHQAADAAAAEEAAAAETAAEAPVADEPASTADPRLAALGLTPDLGEAEAEAAALAADHGDDDEIPTIADDALAARLAGLVPPSDQIAPMNRTQAPAGGVSTKVVVTGLISVASIASFKRHLGRIEGVQSVGVSSGPDGEFVFAVVHAPEVALGDVVPTLQGFEARVTGSGDGVLTVSARDPESEA